MCVVTYFPSNQGFFFTSNRDENSHRKTMYPQFYQHQKHNLLYPKDLEKGGTWFAVNKDEKKMACLLNASSLQPHPHKKISRGHIPLSCLSDDQNFLSHDSLLKTAPFKLIIIHFYEKTQIEELHWNGKKLLETRIDETKPKIWFSNTLYNQKKKQSLTKKFEQDSVIFDKWENIINFHKKIALPNNSPEYLIKNQNIQTVSITSLNSHKKKAKTLYSSLIEKSKDELYSELI